MHPMQLPLMKKDSDSMKNPDGSPGRRPGSNRKGMDFLMVVKLGGGVLIVLFIGWILLHSILHLI
jgi:hypothetical protein